MDVHSGVTDLGVGFVWFSSELLTFLGLYPCYMWQLDLM